MFNLKKILCGGRIINPLDSASVLGFSNLQNKESKRLFRDLLAGDLTDVVQASMPEIPEIDCETRDVCGVARRFAEATGRPPRILHVGNIANNAYNNAKLLRCRGFSCDVLSNDFYQLMACPEWEDADFTASFSDPYRPDWSTVNLHGFKRPRWFVQGTLLTSLLYLWAIRHRVHPATEVLWGLIENQRRAIAQNGDMRDVAVGVLAESLLGDKLEPFDFDARVSVLVQEFTIRYPERSDKLTAEDLEPWRWCMPYWRLVLQQYDAVIGYGCGPIPLMLSGMPYLAFEHGTLREVPFEPDANGRSTALAYALADWVFVTNSDCTEKAERLGVRGYTFINHPYDEDHGLDLTGADELRHELQSLLDADFLVFFPTRQDWVDGGTFGNKANDRLLNAFVELRHRRLRIGMVCCEWGEDVDASKNLLQNAGVAKHVLWSPPLGVVRFIRHCRACDVVADQFAIGAFGGIFFKALAAGATVCSFLDEATMIQRYGEVPPLLNCHTTDEITRKLQAVYDDHEQLEGLALTGREWIKRHHASDEVVALEVKQLQERLNSRVQTI